MRLLLTNDDGISAPGLQTLYDGLKAHYGADNLLVVAPEGEQSACSHALTLHKALRLKQLGAKHFSLSGTPADCVIMGLTQLLPLVLSDVDLVISGINHGANLGTDVSNSGTVSAAIQATLMGKPAIAVSQVYRARQPEKPNFEIAVFAVQHWIEKLRQHPLPAYTFLNLNVPNKLSRADEITYAITPMGIRRYDYRFEKRTDPYGRDYYWAASQDLGGHAAGDTDSEAVAAGKVAVTPMGLDHTNFQLLEQMKSWST